MQIVAYGAQDVYLTANPQITYFKVIYRRHTNFAIESIEQVFNGAADFGRRVTATISRNGDLIHRAYLRVEVPSVNVAGTFGFRWLNWLGHIILQSVEVEIGGQRIDKHYGMWLHIWNELTQSTGKAVGYANMVGNIPQLVNPRSSATPFVVPGQILYIPLEFWWNRNPGLALPLIALQYHEVKINIDIAKATDCYWAGNPTTGVADAAAVTSMGSLNASLFVDYVYLDTDERRRFAQSAHEYAIEQLQFTGDESVSNVSNKIKLAFNHPCKELVWVVSKDTHTREDVPFGKQWFNFTDALDVTYAPAASVSVYGTGGNDLITPGTSISAAGLAVMPAGGSSGVYLPVSFEGGANPVSTALLQLNGHDRFSERDGKYFNVVQPYQHHENVPKAGINVYSFALRPEEHSPSGQCNFSRIDAASLNLRLTEATVRDQLTLTPTTARVRIYAINYNILRILSGMGGVAFSN